MDAARRFRNALTAGRVADRFARLSGPEYASLGKLTAYYCYRQYHRFEVLVRTFSGKEGDSNDTRALKEPYTMEMAEGLVDALRHAGIAAKLGLRMWTWSGYNVVVELDTNADDAAVLEVVTRYAKAFRSHVLQTVPRN